MAKQRQIPGGPYVNETTNDEAQIPGGPYLNQTSGGAAPVSVGYAAETDSAQALARSKTKAVTHVDRRTAAGGSLSMRGRQDVDDFVAAFTGSHHYVVDYLVEEVLSRQSEKTRDFLLQTSILERMTAPLCNALTGNPDGQATLAELERATCSSSTWTGTARGTAITICSGKSCAGACWTPIRRQ